MTLIILWTDVNTALPSIQTVTMGQRSTQTSFDDLNDNFAGPPPPPSSSVIITGNSKPNDFPQDVQTVNTAPLYMANSVPQPPPEVELREQNTTNVLPVISELIQPKFDGVPRNTSRSPTSSLHHVQSGGHAYHQYQPALSHPVKLDACSPLPASTDHQLHPTDFPDVQEDVVESPGSPDNTFTTINLTEQKQLQFQALDRIETSINLVLNNNNNNMLKLNENTSAALKTEVEGSVFGLFRVFGLSELYDCV